jgi:hypothetical protein
MPASGSRPWTGAGVTTRAGRRRSSIAWSAVEHDGPWPQLGQEPQSPKSDWWTRVEGVGDRLIGGRGGDAGFLSDGAPRSSALPLVVAFACKASLTSQISRRVTLRMKHDFSMYSFISRFHIVALAFNSYTVVWSNVYVNYVAFCSIKCSFTFTQDSIVGSSFPLESAAFRDEKCTNFTFIVRSRKCSLFLNYLSLSRCRETKATLREIKSRETISWLVTPSLHKSLVFSWTNCRHPNQRFAGIRTHHLNYLQETGRMLRATIVKSTDRLHHENHCFFCSSPFVNLASEEFSQASGTMTFNISRIFFMSNDQ